MPRILVVEDEPDLARTLKENLELEGHRVQTAADGEKALAAALANQPDLILLDLRLPEKDGIEVCRELRARGLLVPIIMLAARGEEADRVLGLEMGADDYVVKPFSLRELLARVKAVLRRTRETEGKPTTFTIGGVQIDCLRYLARRGRKEFPLSHYEVELLRFLVLRKNEVVSRSELLNAIWGLDAYPSNRTVDNYVAKLRKKLEKNSKKPKFLLTVHGVGYKLVL